jgi:beta-glucosidase
VLLKNGGAAPLLPLAPGRKLYVEGLDKAAAAAFGSLTDSLADADLAILRLQAPFEPRSSELVETFFHQGDLDFKEPELGRIRRILQQKPTIVCLYLDRAAVIPEIAAESAALLADFGVSDDALLDLIFGRARPEGKLPFELPASMEAVRAQQEDAPYDSKDPLFPFGFGLSYP